jgi:hypothetical protein
VGPTALIALPVVSRIEPAPSQCFPDGLGDLAFPPRPGTAS